MKARPSNRWFLAAAATLVAIVTIDAAVGESLILTTAALLPVLALALVGRPHHVSWLAAAAVVAAFAGGFWNDYFASSDHAVRFVLVCVGVVLAVLSARARERSERDRARMTLLADAARISDAPTLQGAVERLAGIALPALATRVWVDLAEAAGAERRRVLDRGEEGGGDRLAIPLRIRETEIGELGFEGRRYDDHDREFLGILAGRVALALGNVRLLNELRQTRERLDRILGALAEAVTVNDAEGRTIYANEAACELLGVRVAPEDPPAPGALASRFIITHEDGTPVTVEEFPGRRLLAGDSDPRPMLTRSVRVDTGREYWLLTKATLLHDADGAPLAVNVIEDVTDAKEAELRQRFLDEAGQVLASSLDYERALQRVAELAVPWLSDWCAVDLAAARTPQRIAVAHTDPEKVALAAELVRRYPPDPDAETGVPAVLRSRKGELYPEIPDEMLVHAARDEEHLRLIREIGMRAAMVVPMTAGDEVLGAMTFVSAESARTFDDDDFAFAQDLARRAAVAVQNGRRYADQVRVAETLQRSLLPDRLPVVPGWEMGASYEAGDERVEVGGDFYDVVPTRDGHLVFLGDVTGKGVEAAALTALVRHAGRTAARFDRQPARLLGVVNALLREQPRLSPVSLVCALIEPRGGTARVTVASGGHPLPLLRRPGEEPREVGRHDVLLGVVAQEAFAEATLEVESGDVLLFYTDGVIDAPGAYGRFGEERLLAALGDGPDEPSALLEAIRAELHDFARAPGADDRAMLALRYTGSRTAAGEPASPPLANARG